MVGIVCCFARLSSLLGSWIVQSSIPLQATLAIGGFFSLVCSVVSFIIYEPGNSGPVPTTKRPDVVTTTVEISRQSLF